MPSPPSEVEWHADGHSLTCKIDRNQFVVRPNPCPVKGDEDAACHVPGVGCVVTHFVNLFGLELNQGVVEPAGELEIAWARFGHPFDPDNMQLWIIPTSDDAFAAWFASESEEA